MQSLNSAASSVKRQSFLGAPNFPVAEPVFFLPRAPDLVKVSEPAPPRRPPPPGYDMKTLRKQLDYLQQEINERADSQRQVCSQNEQLWQYVEDLLQANQFNAAQMREHVNRINEELRRAHKERYELAERLELARNSKQMLQDLQREFSEGQINHEELHRRKEEAERELSQARKDREEMEDSLKIRVGQLQEYEDILDQYRTRQKEEEAFERAEDFFFSNKVVLRAAYQRFREGVRKRMRCSNIQQRLTSFYHAHLKRSTWGLWQGFLERKQVMNGAVERRRDELIKLTFARWKVYSALEKLCRGARRRLLLTKTLQTWKTFTVDSLFENQAEEKTTQWKVLLMKRKFFQAWRQGVVLLGWHQVETLQKERGASTYFRRRLLQQWHLVHLKEEDRFINSTQLVKENFLRIRFRLWHTICRRRWRFRGGLLRRFFRNTRRGIANRASTTVTHKHALYHWIAVHKRQAISHWLHFAREKRLLKGPFLILSFARRKAIYKAFLLFEKNIFHLRQQSIATHLATKHYLQRLVSTSVRQWLRTSRVEKKSRCLQRKVLQRHALRSWMRAMQIQKQETNANNLADSLIVRQKERHLLLYVKKWQNVLRWKKRISHCEDFLVSKRLFGLLRNSFAHWKGKWGKALFWRHKEMQIDQARAKALEELHVSAIEDYEQQQALLQRQNAELEDTILSLQEMLVEKKSEVEKQTLLLADRERARDQLRDEVLNLQQDLRLLEEEKERWKVLEQTINGERAEREKEREKKRREMQHQVKHMEAETKLLKKDIHDAKEQLLQATESIQGEVQACAEEYEQVQQELEDAKKILQQRIQEEQELVSDQEELMNAMQHIKQKVADATAEGQVLRDENEGLLRQRLSEVRVLKGDVGVASARVEALFGILQEYEDEHKKMHLDDIQEQEVK